MPRSAQSPPKADSEKSPLLSSHSGNGMTNSASSAEEENADFHAYKRRWWILFVFCLTAYSQGLLWNTWSPIQDAVQIAFNVTNSFSAITLAGSDLACVIATFPLMYAVEHAGLRCGMVVSSAMLVLCCAVWNIVLPLQKPWFAAIGSILNGITCAFALAAPSLLSATWFPSSERTMATSFATLSVTLGTGVAYISGPYISGANVTTTEVDGHDSIPFEFRDQLSKGILEVVYFGTSFSIACFIGAVIYFPLKPPKPPSKSQLEKRKDFWQGLKLLVVNPNFWLLNISFNLSNGLFNAWMPLISVNFRFLGVDEGTLGWIGFTGTIVSSVSSVFMSIVIDRFKRKMKLLLQLANICALAMYIILSCIQERYIELPQQSTIVIIYLLCGGTALCINGVTPIYYELACECAFPVHEGLTCSLLGMMNSSFGVIYFLLFLNPTLATDTQWMTWTCAGASVLTIPLLILVKESFTRLNLDTCSSDDKSGSTEQLVSTTFANGVQ